MLSSDEKIYLIDLYDEFIPGSSDRVEPHIAIELNIKDFIFSLRLLSFSNKKQTATLYRYHQEIMKKFLHYLEETITTQRALHAFIEKVENPKLDIAKKLLQNYSYSEVEEIVKSSKRYNPILNLHDVSEFLPRYIFKEEQLIFDKEEVIK